MLYNKSSFTWPLVYRSFFGWCVKIYLRELYFRLSTSSGLNLRPQFTAPSRHTAMAAFIQGTSSLGLVNGNYCGRPFLLSGVTPPSRFSRVAPLPVFSVVQRRNLKVRATETDTSEVKSRSPDNAPSKNNESSGINQLLGIKGAAQETDKWKIRLQLTKPVTWPPLIWGVACGAAASGNFHWNIEDVAKSIVCMILAGPFLTGYTQTLNDWYDREIDAINEPYRPIPSGAISESEVINQIWVLLLGGLGLAALLDVWAGHTFPSVFYIAIGGSLLSYIYSAPPLKLKQNGWIGNFALGSSYICLPWWAGQALFGTLAPDVMVLTILYSIAGLGIAIVNDFKSIEGDRAMGLQSLPVAFGIENAKWICVGAIDITQLSVAGYLFATGKLYYALVLLGLIAPQVIFQFQYLLKDPIKYDVKYQASAQPFLVLGLLVTALATSH